ncbi:MAG: type IX secretion system membrane protein PorP/SprF [Bacteroidales bacterium]|nr:type IX secretion system membrane protein PorP/SprF [Bacteroidales bacterium]
MKPITYILVIILIRLGITVGFAQDPQLSQFYASPLYLAPSFAGSTDGSRVVMNYRNQWPSINVAYQTFAVSYDHYFPSQSSGIGIFMIKDVAGSGNLSTTNLGLQYAFNFKVNHKWYIRPGLQMQVTQRKIDFEKLIFFEQLTFQGILPINSEAGTMENISYLDFSSSVMAFGMHEWGGLVIHHMNRPNESLQGHISEVPTRVSIFGGKKFVFNSSANDLLGRSITASIMYRAQKKFDQLDLGCYWTSRPLVLGFWYRGLPLFKKYAPGYGNNDAIVFMAGYQSTEFKIGYSYDFTISRLVARSGGSHEISLIYEFWQDQKVKGRKKVIVPCPKF